MISQLTVIFNPNAIKTINEICKCDPIEGVSLYGDDVPDIKPSTTL